MDDESVAALKMNASRGEYASMVALSAALFRKGLPVHSVLRECYGVDFPAEFLVMAGVDRFDTGLFVEFTNQPWECADPVESAGALKAPRIDEVERQLFEIDDDLVPLLRLIGSRQRLGGSVICYRLSELSDGRSTVFAVKEELREWMSPESCGASLLDLLLEFHGEAYEALIAQRDSESNFGSGMVDDDEVAEVYELIEEIAQMRRKAGLREV